MPRTQPEHRNHACLVGEVRTTPQTRTLPSGDEVVSFRLAVERPAAERRSSRSPKHDVFDVSCFTAGTRRTASRLKAGSTVLVEGAFRRQVRRAAGVAVVRTDLHARRVTRRFEVAAAG